MNTRQILTLSAFVLGAVLAAALLPATTTVMLVGMAVGTYAVSVSAGGLTINKTVQRTGDGQASIEITLAAGKTVTGWTDTDSNTASCTLPGGHGYSNGNFDVYWTSGGTSYCRRNVPGTISTNALSLDGGAGDNFPATSTTGVVVCKQTAFNLQLDGDNAKIVAVCAEIAASVTTQQHVSFLDSGSAQVCYQVLTANSPSVCDIAGGQTNAYTGNVITNGVASNGDPTYSATLKVIAVVDATP